MRCWAAWLSGWHLATCTYLPYLHLPSLPAPAVFRGACVRRWTGSPPLQLEQETFKVQE